MFTLYIVTHGAYENYGVVRAFLTKPEAQAFRRGEEAKEKAEHDRCESIHAANGHRPKPMGKYPYISDWGIETLDLSV